MDNCRSRQDVAEFNTFLGRLPHRYKIVVGGNHDHILAANPAKTKELLSEAIYLQDEMVVIDGVAIYGAPWQPCFNDRACDAFALPRGRALEEKWACIPEKIDILITHGPPMGVMDQDGPVSHGCSSLAEAVREKQPKVHIFGLIHSQHGTCPNGATTFINCNVQGRRNMLRPALSFTFSASRSEKTPGGTSVLP
jgi:Icc-related predicted phosphoesterase